MKKILAILFVLTCTSLIAQYAIGDKVNNFTLVNAADNNPVSLQNFSGAKVVVLVFTSHNCPYSKIYEERIKKYMTEYESKSVKFILINPNNPDAHPEDGLSEMAAAYKSKNFGVPYLSDPKQEVANAYGATKTPEVMVLKSTGGVFTLKYRGAIDDNPQVGTDVTVHYLKEALEATLTGGVLKYSEKRATGCMIYR
ncbi:MAG: thioredoxin family protein [Cytophagaceae bacterium]|nr:thioredoxin family protein [Cytophagaceae bacterium]